METDGSGAVGVPAIDRIRCSGCGRCVAACPEKIISLETIGHHKTAVIRSPVRCTRCQLCVASCPIAAIEMEMPDNPEP